MTTATQLHLTIDTAEGQYSHTFNGHGTVQAVIDQTKAHLHLTTDPNNPWVIDFNGHELNSSTTLEHNHIPDGATLLMHRRFLGGGTWTKR